MQETSIEKTRADLEVCAAPVTEIESVTRDSLLKPPDWRYQAACQYLSDLRHGIRPSVSTDPLIQYAIRGIRGSQLAPGKSAGLNLVTGAQRMMQHCWPELMETLYRGTYGRHSAQTATMEVCLIKGWSHEDAKLAGCPASPRVYKLYEKLFFDLTGVRTVTAWIQDNLFEPERYNGNTVLLRARLMAYFGDGTTGMSASISGQLPDSDGKLMKSLIKNERQKRLFDYVVKHTGMDPELYANVMETALKSMTEHDFQEHMKDREDAGSSSLEELTDGLERGIRAFSQTELQDVRTDGLDFVNQYTKILTGKSDNGKENIS